MRRTTFRARLKGRRRAAILVVTLWIVVILGLISASMLEEVYLELKLARFQRDDFEATMLARAGLARAVADLNNDLLLDRQGPEQPYDALGDVWAQADEEKVDVKMGRGAWSVWVDDESSKLNLNAINPLALKALLHEMGLDEESAQSVTAAIMDWRDPDDQVFMPPGVGKEDEYYSAVVSREKKQRWTRNDPPIYRCKNDTFSSVEELLSVAGVTKEMFYGFDPDKEEVPSPIERLKRRAEQSRRREAREQKPGLRDLFTVSLTPAVNINTADPFVLRVLFRAAMNDQAQAKAMADKILQLRRPDAQGNSRNESVFRSITDLPERAGIAPDVMARLMQMAPLVTRSDFFRVSALGELGRSQHLICVSVRRGHEVVSPQQLGVLFKSGLIGEDRIDGFRRRHGNREESIEQSTVRVMQWYEL